MTQKAGGGDSPVGFKLIRFLYVVSRDHVDQRLPMMAVLMKNLLQRSHTGSRSRCTLTRRGESHELETLLE